MYELLIVSKIGESDGLLSRVEKILKDSSAADVKVEKLGKKTLAYQIKKQAEADYTLMTFNAEGSAISDLTDMLRLEQEALLRYLILVAKAGKLRKKVSKKAERVEEVREEKKPKVTVVTKTKVVEKVKEKKASTKKKVASAKK